MSKSSDKNSSRSQSSQKVDDDKQQQAAAAAAAAKARAEADAKSAGQSQKTSTDNKSKGGDASDRDDSKPKSGKAEDKKDQGHQGQDDDGKHVADASKDDDKNHIGDKSNDKSDHDAKARDEHDKTDGRDDKSAHAGEHDDGKCDGDKRDGDKDDDRHGHVTPPVVTPPTPPTPVEAMVLKAADVSNVGTGSTLVGSKASDALHATTGHDEVFGRGGNDVIHGADAAPVTLPVSIDGWLVNAANADALNFLVSGMPAGAALSAGHDNGNGAWSLSKADLAHLSITASANSDFTLHVTASAIDGSGLSQNADVHVIMHAGQGNLLSGGAGNDTIYGSANGDDYIYGGSVPTGTHTGTHVPTAADNDVIHVGNGNAHVWGQSGDDQIYAGGGNDTIFGGSGNDVVHAGTGTGAFTGGSGFDTLDFSAVGLGVTVDLKAKTVTGGSNLTVKGFEAVIGSTHSDSIWGDANANVFTGGGGSDTFGFRKSDLKFGNVDHITDFGTGDQLDVSGLVHGKAQNLIVSDGQAGMMISAKVGGVLHDVVVLDGVHGMTAQDMLAHGMILA